MPDSWRKAYGELKDYITRNPGIEIDRSGVVIADDVRSEFYRLFRIVCVSFGKDKISPLLEKAYVLSKKWGQVSQSVINDLKLESIDVDAGIKWFLLDPDDCLMRELFDTLFNLLKGKSDLAAFEKTGSTILEDKFTRLNREGYQCWAVVSLLKLLSVDKAYHIPRSDLDREPSHHQEELRGTREENPPDAVETKTISFEHNHMFSFLVPKVIIRPTSSEYFAALGYDFDFNEARWRIRKGSPEKEWIGISEIVREYGRDRIWPDMAIYTGTNIKELAVIADYFEMARPDIIVEFRAAKNWYEKEGLEIIRRHNNVLKPRLGSFVVCLEPVPEAAIRELEDKSAPQLTTGALTTEPVCNIRLLSVGYDGTKLGSIIESVNKVRTKP